jgi:hypothetical protein
MVRQKHRLLTAALVLLALSGGPGHAQEKPPTIRLKQPTQGGGQARFEVAGIEPAMLERWAKTAPTREQWNALFRVFVDNGTGAKGGAPLPLLGSSRIADGLLIFEPRFPLEPGLRYRAEFNGPPRQSIAASFAIPKEKPQQLASVLHVYPSRDRLPENLLKFYIHFSVPMSRGQAYQRVRLLDAVGRPVDMPFLELEQELWSPDGKRFTLFLDPGRIKRGLKPREEAGPVLEEGKSYTLVIDQHWHDAKGNPLKETFRKPFKVGPPDDAPLDPKRWKLRPPTAGKGEPLVVRFPKPLDHALLQSLLWIVDESGRRVAGTVAVSDEETRWQFTPQRPWQAGRYQLVVDRTLEDLAGNSVGKPFEVDVFHPIRREPKAERVAVPFEVKSLGGLK